MPNNGKTLRNLRLKPGTAYMKAQLNARRPRVVNVRTLFPNVRPPVLPPPAPPANPAVRVNSPLSFFRGLHVASPFNLKQEDLGLTPKELAERRTIERLHLRQKNGAKAVEQNPHANHVVHFNESAGGLVGTPGVVVGGRNRTNKKRNYGKAHKHRKTRTRKHK